MSLAMIEIATHGEQFYSITEQVKDMCEHLVKNQKKESGILFLFNMHTSCGLVLSENYDSTAQSDMENFLKYLAPRNLNFIQHTLEGSDDSPSHMKSLLIQQHLAILVEKGCLQLGTWQGIFLAEFRDAPKKRKIQLKFLADS